MRLLTRDTATRCVLPPLPPGFEPATPTTRATPPRPLHEAPPAMPATQATSGVLHTVATRNGADATLHRAGYDIRSSRGEYTVHGYAWRCTRCSHLTTGYLPHDGFRRALRDASNHQCEARHG